MCELLWWLSSCLLQRCRQGTVLLHPLLVLWAISPVLLWISVRLPCGAPLDDPLLEGPDMALFFFFSSASAQALRVPSLLMAALAKALSMVLGRLVATVTGKRGTEEGVPH
jgi:hypothetical protein